MLFSVLYKSAGRLIEAEGSLRNFISLRQVRYFSIITVGAPMFSLSLSLYLFIYVSFYSSLSLSLSLYSHVPPNHSLSYTCTRTRTSSGTRLQWKWYQTRYCQYLLSPSSCHWSGSVHFTVIIAEKFSFHFTVIIVKFSVHFTVIIEKFSVQFCIFFGLLITTLHKTQIGHWDTDSGVWWVGERSDETNSSPFLHQFSRWLFNILFDTRSCLET